MFSLITSSFKFILFDYLARMLRLYWNELLGLSSRITAIKLEFVPFLPTNGIELQNKASINYWEINLLKYIFQPIYNKDCFA